MIFFKHLLTFLFYSFKKQKASKKNTKREKTPKKERPEGEEPPQQTPQTHPQKPLKHFCKRSWG